MRSPALPAPADAVRLGRRRIFILPTRHGYTFALVLALMLVGSVNYNNSLGFVLTFLLASLALVSMLHTYRNLAGLAIRPGRSHPAFAGGLARFGLCLDNRGHAGRHALVLRYRPGDDGWAASADAPAEGVLHTGVAADDIHNLEFGVSARRRGRLALGRVVLATRHPLGLFRAWTRLDLDMATLVYPAPAGVHELPASGGHETRESGVAGRGREDFAGLREYRPGDSPRQIHWKAVAREMGVPVKLFSGASAASLVLRFDDTPGRDVEARLSQLCRWALEADALDVRYGLELPGRSIAPDSGETHRRACLEALALHGL